MEADPTMQHVAVRTRIDAALLSYCRGIDRLDAAAVRAAFHPGAMLIDYGPEPMSIEAFAEYAVGALGRRFRATQHRISNTAVDLDGDRAMVETYVLAFHLEGGSDGGGDRLHTFNGRYVDRFERRDDRWLIATRTLRVDWSRIEPVSEPMAGSWVASGRGGHPDPLSD